MGNSVSIIMPSYNTGRFISETIESVLAQSYSDWELIIVDDCSNDNTDDVVTQYLVDARIRYIKNETKENTIRKQKTSTEISELLIPVEVFNYPYISRSWLVSKPWKRK